MHHSCSSKDFLDDRERFQVSLVKILNRANQMESTYDSQVWLWQECQENEIEKDVQWFDVKRIFDIAYYILLLSHFLLCNLQTLANASKFIIRQKNHGVKLWKFAEMTTSWKEVSNQAAAPSLDAESSEPTGKGELQHLVQRRHGKCFSNFVWMNLKWFKGWFILSFEN